ncbi:PPA1309 family protein [Streptomyces somaliensis]|uniref:PPA1309 family protein n=1 Tax=Streptomyces somaliensis TaxID=78355 RepID=UPI0020CE267C|nr:PPA1309 family protein [Streptomyces somaliensis]MCP9944653.1 PPA1309 family protein [Streptomyces somaliensis]MCP9962124.1 PPA1309 family protein [Streptomyces somaliensis]MCP9974936.1 PPA1309 family protein [Streptomyces somaliensis]
MSNVSPSGPPMAAGPLTRAVLEIDEYVSGLGWDQPARLFALVDTARLRSDEPGLAARLGLGPGGAASPLTPIEQEELPAGAPLDEFLATVAWPDAVTGCALTVERLMLPPSAEGAVPDGLDEAGLAEWVAAHPDRQEVRMTVAVLRGGARESAIRLREKDSPTEVLTGSDLVPGLADALAATFEG